MPQASSVSGDDYASNDEVKVYKDEGENEDEKRSENLNEEKLGLVTETEEGKSSDIEGQECFNSDDKSSVFLNRVKMPDLLLRDQFPFSYPLFHHYPYASTSPLVSNNKLFPPPPPGLGFLMYGGGTDAITSPPPAHMGIPPLHIDLKTGLSRPPLYGLSHSIPSPSHLYPPSAVASGDFPHLSVPPGSLHSPYSPPTLPSSPLSWFSAPAIFPHNFPFSHPSTFHPFNHPSTRHPPHELSPLSESLEHSRNATQASSHHRTPAYSINHHQPHRAQSHKLFNATSSSDKRRSYVKKPLNAFMLFMKEMRQKVIEECTLKESAAINQILGRKWHALDRSDQAKYYEMAKKEKESHMQLYPGWSARDNYATHTKKKKKREGSEQDAQINKKLRLQFNPMEPSSTINDSSLRPPGLITNGSQHHLDVLNITMD